MFKIYKIEHYWIQKLKSTKELLMLIFPPTMKFCLLLEILVICWWWSSILDLCI